MNAVHLGPIETIHPRPIATPIPEPALLELRETSHIELIATFIRLAQGLHIPRGLTSKGVVIFIAFRGWWLALRCIALKLLSVEPGFTFFWFDIPRPVDKR
jgi:hypothetical protein